MSHSGFIAVELVDRGDGTLVPDVESASDLLAFATHEAGSEIWHLEKGRHCATFRKIGVFNTNLIFETVCSTQQAWDALESRLGAKVFTYVAAVSRPLAQLTWLASAGYSAIKACPEGDTPQPLTDPAVAVLPSLVFAGQDPVSLAIGDSRDPLLHYYSGSLI